MIWMRSSLDLIPDIDVKFNRLRKKENLKVSFSDLVIDDGYILMHFSFIFKSCHCPQIVTKNSCSFNAANKYKNTTK